jgi:agmatine deiminase
MKRQRKGCILSILLVVVVAIPASALAWSMAQEVEGQRYLPIGLTPEEEANLELIGTAHRGTAPPAAAVRNPAEFERMLGVIVRYPWGNPDEVLVEYAEDDTLWVIVMNENEETFASSELTAAGADMGHVKFIYGKTNSFWTRDYGPWFITDELGQQGIVDIIYNRPRPLDDKIPGVVGEAWSTPVYAMDLIGTGGNIMFDGLGVAMSSELILNENPELTEAQIDSMILAYSGVHTYLKLPYIEVGGIHHIDCWAKLLDPGRILVREVPPSHPAYDEIEANVSYFESLTSSWGKPYEIVRIYTPNDEPYINSFVLNDKVLVPTYGTEWDDDALATYEAVLPGYEVVGFDGPWLSDDALHCRAIGATDPGMLYIDHMPLGDVTDPADSYRVEAEITDYSGAGLVAEDLYVSYRVDADPEFTAITMTESSRGGTYYADIPGQSEGAVVSYYVDASDYSGRHETHPWVAPANYHSFDVLAGGTGVPDDGQAQRFSLEQNRPNPFNPKTVLAYDLPQASNVTLVVHNAAGRKIATLVDRHVGAGGHTATWRGLDDDGQSVSSGVYFFTLTYGGESITRKGVLLK